MLWVLMPLIVALEVRIQSGIPSTFLYKTSSNCYLPFCNRFELYFWLLGYCFAKLTSNSCCVTTSGTDKIGGLQKGKVTHAECRELCSTYDWCSGVQITYDGANAVHNEKCRLLTSDASISLSGWTHFNKVNWVEPSEWHDCCCYPDYNCYKKYAPG